MLRVLGLCCAAILVSAGVVHAKISEYHLVIDKQLVRITKNPLLRITINGMLPGPVLHFRDEDDAVIHVTNRMDEVTSIHWHGFLLLGDMDGVPGFNGFRGIEPGETYTYRFKIRQDGTYWYHAHSRGQEQDGNYGAIVVSPATKDADTAIVADRDYVVLLSDFHQDDSETIFSNLKKSSEYYSYTLRTFGDFMADVGEHGFGKAWKDAKVWGEMRMRPTDLADINNYTFLINGKTSKQNWTAIFQPKETVRLRFINASAMSLFDVRIPELPMTVVAADGQRVEAVTVDEFRFGAAETYDVLVSPEGGQVYTIVAEPVDRTGFATATLAEQHGMRATMPEQRRRSLLTVADMGMDHEMEHGYSKTSQAEHQMMSVQQDSAIEETTDQTASHNPHSHPAKAGHTMSSMSSMSSMSAMEDSPDYKTGVAGSGWADADTPDSKKSLSYMDLRYLGNQQDTRSPQREIAVRLGGNMERYIWTMNGQKYSADAAPINLQYGERVRLRFINDTMMAHPMHLHGMFMQLENGQPMDKLPNKHTVVIAPGDSYSVLLTADEVGEWAFHCHLLYHMMSGMMTKVEVAKLVPAELPLSAQSPSEFGS